MSKKKLIDTLICGCALFAIFFGAGNLIFPPYLGVISGEHWGLASLAFALSDPLLPAVGVVVTAYLGGSALDFGSRVSKHFAAIVGAISILLIGPVFAVPRTGATTHEVFVQSFFPNAPQWVTSVVFFALVLYIAFNSNTVIDAIGKYLTPLLLIILLIVFIAAVVTPSDFAARDTSNLFSQSFKEGYQTMDALGAPLLAGAVMTDVMRRGYDKRKDQLHVMIGVGIVTFVLLAIVYTSLTYSGATVSTQYDSSIPRTTLLINLIDHLLGSFGKIAMGVVVSLACLTTAVGLTSTTGNYFQTASNGKLSYKKVVVVAVLVEFVISLLGVNALLSLAAPILSTIYPMVIAVMILSIFDKYIRYNWTYTGAVLGAFVIGVIQGINTFSQLQGGNLLQSWADWTTSLPLNAYGFEWLLPAIIGSVLLTIISAVTGIGGQRKTA